VEELYRAHAPVVFAYLLGLTADRHRAEDLLQETFVRATRAIAGYRGGSPQAWLLAIARTTFLDDLRRRVPAPTDEHPEPATVDPDVVEQLTVRGALSRLSEPHRTVLVLRDQLGLSYQQVADTIDRSLGATKVLIHRARRAFRDAYAEEGGHD
jgi:RNA polymerase sigma factor (sigma-70 family)